MGGDILQTDVLRNALSGAEGVFHFAALWLLQCHEIPRTAFDVNIRGTFNVLEACVATVRNGWYIPRPRLSTATPSRNR